MSNAIFKNHVRLQPDNGSPADGISWPSNIEHGMFLLANDIWEGIGGGFGDGVLYSYPYCGIVSTQNIAGFSGASFQGLWGVYPPNYIGYPEDPRAIPLVIDKVPDGFIPEAPFYIFAVVGENPDPYKAHEAIVNAIKALDPQLVLFGAIGFGNPNISEPNSYLGYTLPLDQRFPFDGPVGNNIPLPAPAVALNTTSGSALNGGYTCFVGGSVLQIEQDSRDQNEYARVCFMQNAVSAPVEINAQEGVTRTPFFFLRLDSTNWRIATGGSYLYVAGSGNALSGAGDDHLELALVSLPNAGSGTFAVGGNSGAEASFKKGMQASGTYMITSSGAVLFSEEGGSGSHNVPRVMQLWFDRGDGLWENGLAQLTEPWVGFAPIAGKSGAVFGKLPNALIANGRFHPDSDPLRDFDNRMWAVFGYSTQDGSTLLVLAEKGEDEIPYPLVAGDCP